MGNLDISNRNKEYLDLVYKSAKESASNNKCYLVAMNKGSITLEDVVNKIMLAGYEPQGGVCEYQTSNGGKVFAQALILPRRLRN